MNRKLARNKICYNTNEIVWNNRQNYLKLHKKKWRPFISKNVKKVKNLFQTYEERPDSLKKLYKKRFFNKQIIKAFYGFLPEYKFKNIFKFINKKKHQINSIENFLIHLETKIDIFLYRAGVVKNVFEAKQLISHKNVKINDNFINSSNVYLLPGDFISFTKEIKFRIKKLKYLEYNKRLNVLILLKKPSFKNIKYSFLLNKNFLLEYLRVF